MVGVVGVAEVAGVKDVDVALVDDLGRWDCTLLAGLEKNWSQF